MWCVYTHTSPSGKVYVGISSNLKIRWSNKGYRYTTYNSIFKRVILKYGWDNIKHDVILSNVSKEEACYTERYLIKWYKLHNLSYNITDGGEGTLGRRCSEETKLKMRASAKGWSRRAIEASILSRKNSDYYKKGLSKAHEVWRGSHHSDVTKKKLSDKAKGRDMSKVIEASRNSTFDRGKGKRKGVLQCDLNNNIINEFPSITEATKFLNKSSHSIANCLACRTKTAFGYMWKYKYMKEGS